MREWERGMRRKQRHEKIERLNDWPPAWRGDSITHSLNPAPTLCVLRACLCR
jgi:hypothetical protein